MSHSGTQHVIRVYNTVQIKCIHIKKQNKSLSGEFRLISISNSKKETCCLHRITERRSWLEPNGIFQVIQSRKALSHTPRNVNVCRMRCLGLLLLVFVFCQSTYLKRYKHTHTFRDSDSEQYRLPSKIRRKQLSRPSSLSFCECDGHKPHNFQAYLYSEV